VRFWRSFPLNSIILRAGSIQGGKNRGHNSASLRPGSLVLGLFVRGDFFFENDTSGGGFFYRARLSGSVWFQGDWMAECYL